MCSLDGRNPLHELVVRVVTVLAVSFHFLFQNVYCLHSGGLNAVAGGHGGPFGPMRSHLRDFACSLADVFSSARGPFCCLLSHFPGGPPGCLASFVDVCANSVCKTESCQRHDCYEC